MKNKLQYKNRGELKKKMLNACIQKHQTVIDDFQQSIKELLGSGGLINEEELDLSQQGFNTEMVQRADAIADQLEFANQEMKLLYDMLPTIGYIQNTVQAGSVVITDKMNFFVSTSIEEFEVEGMKVFGLSTASPVFLAMEGKKEGEVFTFKEAKYKIQEVF